MGHIQFIDRLVRYETFVDDVASAVVKKLKVTKDDPEHISQRQAYRIFGRANVERWRRSGLIEPCKRPGKLEYKTAELRYLQSKKQDYFSNE